MHDLEILLTDLTIMAILAALTVGAGVSLAHLHRLAKRFL